MKVIGALLCALLAADAVRAQTPDDDGMPFAPYFSMAADEIRLFLEQQRAPRNIAVVFTGPATWKSSGSNRLVEELKAELARHQIKIESPANYAFNGQYKMTKSGKLRITGTIVDRLGDVPPTWTEMPACVDDDPKLISTVMGLSTDLTPRAGLQAVSEVRNSYLNPTIAVTGAQSNIARPSATSPFGVQILVNKQPKPLTAKSGMSFVELDLNDTFEVSVVNDAPYEMATSLAIDGLSIFHFSELRKSSTTSKDRTEPRFRYYIAAPRSSALVQGWEKNATTVRAFKIVPFEECAAVQSGQTTDIGMITVSFHASWEKGRTQPPADEDTRKFDTQKGTRVYTKRQLKTPDGKVKYVWQAVASVSTTKVGTGFGQDILVSSQGVQREIGATRGLVTIRYARKETDKK